MADLYLYAKGSGTPFLIFPETNKHMMPVHYGEFAWILKDAEGKVLDSYTPAKPKRTKPCTSYKNSWADQEARKR